MRVFAIGIFVLTTTAPLLACLWDRDTFAMEARGRLEVVETAVGWFDRFPPEYYQMRLDRVAPEIAADPKRLDLYDDAAVACDRLGKHEEAVAWMEKKAAAMQALPAAQTQDHRYRRLANLGVFHTHLWLKSPDRERNVVSLDQAIQHVKEALKINPNAHFGRESAHLGLLEWWREGLKENSPADWSLLTSHYSGGLTDSTSVKGLCGLIQMGSAQESVDVHALLAYQLALGHQRLEESHYSLTHLTCLRLGELMLDQKTAVHPALLHEERWKHQVEGLRLTPEGRTESVNTVGRSLIGEIHLIGSRYDVSIIARYFHEARAAAVRRQADKTAFMLAQFQQGRHPDTHAGFWQGWQEPVLPPIPPQAAAEKYAGLALGGWVIRNERLVLGGFVCLVGALGLTVILAMIRPRKRRVTATGDGQA
ncbi:MAG TPA: hypothetical protein VGE39_01745 [Prosthecobacter sp.]